MVKIETFRNNFLEKYREVLFGKGFEFIKTSGSGELWHGFINIKDKSDNSEIKCDVCIYFTDTFPYTHPEVFALSDDDFIKNSRHQNNNFLCLWNEGEWNTYMSPENFYKRIEEWFNHSINNDWENKDRKADLDRHFCTNSILAINDNEWKEFPFDSAYGYYKYVKLSFKDYIQGVFIYSPQNGVVSSGLFLAPSQKFTPNNNKILKAFHYFEQNQQNTFDGIWFYCKEEIKPCTNFEELKKQIYKLCDATQDIIDEEFKKVLQAPIENVMFSILYKDFDSELQWVHFDYNKKENILETFKTCKCDDESLALRVKHLKTKIHDKKIAIFGIGAIGSFVTESLGRHGLKEISLIDHDILEPQNIIRHALSACYIGVYKARAMSQVINNFSLGNTKTKCYFRSKYDIKEYEEIINDADIVIDCTANRNFSLMLNHICLKNNKQAIYITSHKKASIGKVIVVRPHVDPCLCCYYGQNGIIDEYEKFDYPYIAQDITDEINLGCGDVTYPGVSSDIEMIALWGVKITLWLLQGNFEHNYCLIVNDELDIENIHPDLKSIGHKFRKFKKLEGCEICGQ